MPSSIDARMGRSGKICRSSVMEMIADRTIKARRATWEDDVDGNAVNRTMGIASLGGATLDNKEKLPHEKAVHRAWRGAS